MSKSEIGEVRSLLGIVCVFMLFALIVFGGLLAGNSVLFSTDNNIGQNAAFQMVLRTGGFMNWGDSPFVGFGGVMPPSLTSLLNEKLPVVFFTNWIHALYMVGASVFLAWFLHRNGVQLAGTVIAGLVAFWLSTNLTLVYSGHTGKYGVLFFMTLALWCIQKAVIRDSVLWSGLTGGAIAMALLEQQDVALIIGIFWAGYAVHAMVRRWGWKWRWFVRLLIPMGIMVIWIAGPVSLLQLQFQTKDVVMAGGESPEAKWEFVTQWSQVPDESVGFIAPGYMGWRSGDPEAPYWGRSGRSANWGRSGQGFMNFKLDDWYVGAVPLTLALFALTLACNMRTLRQREDESVSENTVMPGKCTCGWLDKRAEIIFWGTTALLALLFAFGKYCPLYELLYHVPVINNIRNPAKFLHVFLIALGILTAYGLDGVRGVLSRRDRDHV